MSLLQRPGRRGDTDVLIGAQIQTYFSFYKALYLQRSYCEETEGTSLYVAERGARVQILSLDKASDSKPSLKGFCPWPWTPPNLKLQKGQSLSLCPFLGLLCLLSPFHLFLLNC